MNATPLISILMTAFNREYFIGEAIESVLESTYSNYELIIVDDASKDNTVAIAKTYEAKESRIKVYINDKNLGDYPNRNKAANYARGEFIMYLDSDDTILKDGLQKCVDAIHKYPGEKFGMYSPFGEAGIYKMDSRSAIRQHLFVKPFLMIGPGGTIIKRDFFNKIKGYPEKYGPANDLYFNLKACSKANIIMMPMEFIFYRRHKDQQLNDHFSYLYNNYCYFRDALHELDLPVSKSEVAWLKRKNKRRFVVSLVKNLLTRRNFGITRQAIRNAEFTLQDALSGIFH